MKIDRILLSVEIDFPKPAGVDGRLFLPTAEQFALALEGGILHWIASSYAVANLSHQAGGPVGINIKIAYDRAAAAGAGVVMFPRPFQSAAGHSFLACNDNAVICQLCGSHQGNHA